jgi:hypothetical protein
MNKKILYFDYWTKGFHNNISPLDQIFQGAEVDRIMVHLGSWRVSNKIDQEIIDGLLCCDISRYKNNIRKMLLIERPDVLYTLNVGGVVDRLVNRICRNLDIPVVFMMHGIPPLGSNINIEKKKLNRGYNLVKRLSKAPKYLRIYSQYFYEILSYSPAELFCPSSYKHLIQMLLSPGSVYSDPCKDRDLSPNITLVYAQAYKNFYEERLGFKSECVKITGNPNLDSIFSLNRSMQHQSSAAQRLIIFIVDGMEEGIKGSFTQNDWIQELREVAGVVKAFGGRLIFKLHPSNNRSLVEAEFDGLPFIKVVQDEVDLSIVRDAFAVIGHISSALLVPVALKIPVLVPGWTPIYKDYDYYVANGVATSVNSPEELLSSLRLLASNKNHFFSEEKNVCFSQNYIGPMDGGSWQRVAKEIQSILSVK